MSTIRMNSTATKSLKPMMLKHVKDENLKRVRRFCRILEKNMNCYYNPEYFHDPNRVCKGFFLKIDSINGIKKAWNNNTIPQGRKFYLRIFMTFFNQQTSQFIGNTFKSPLMKVKFNPTGHYEIDEKDPLYVYFLTQAQSNNYSSGKIQYDQCIIEIIFVETNENDCILSQSCEAWGILNITDEINIISNRTNSASLYLGTCRQLIHKSSKITENHLPINGASIIFSCSTYKEIESIKILIPNYYILSNKDKIYGLLLDYLPSKPILNEPIKLVEFHDVYLKNVEIEISHSLESQLIQTAKIYRKQKLELTDDNLLSPIVVKERKLRCGIHNTYSFINSNGMDNFVSLNAKENFLFYKGVHHIDYYFHSEFCAFVFELTYTLAIPIGKNGSVENLDFIVGYLICVPSTLDLENNFRAGTFITGPGVTVYGEHMFEFTSQEDKIIKINFIISKNKENFEKTFKEKEIEEIKTQMNQMKKSLIEDYNKKLGTKDREIESLLRKKELEIEDMEQKLKESQRELKTLYDKEDFVSQETRNYFNMTQMNNTNNNNPLTNTKFVIEEDLERADQQLPEGKEELIRRVSKIPTIIPANDKIYSNSFDLKQQLTLNYNSNMEEKSKSNASIHEKINNESQTEIDNSRRKNSLMNNSEVKKINNRYEEEKLNNTIDENNNRNSRFYNTYNSKPKDYEEEAKEKDPEKESINIQTGNNRHHPKIIYDQNSKDISRKDKAELIAKGLISLDVKEKSENLLNYTLDKELQDEKKAYNFVFHFLAYKPSNSIRDYKSVPDKIFFKFNFWDFENFTTSVAIVSKPNSTIAPSSIPLILQRENSSLSAKSDEKEMKIEINYDPSEEPYMDYKDFIEYLLNRQLFVEIYDAEKLFYIGFCKIPLKELLRQGRPNVYLTKEFDITDDKMNSKGAIQILLKSNGMKTNKNFNYDVNLLKIINTKDRNNTVQKKKKIKSNAIDIQKISKDEKEYIAKTILTRPTEETIKSEDTKGLNSFALKIDKDTEKRLRVMKYTNQSNHITYNNSLSLPEEKLKQYHIKQEKEMEFYKTLNYVNRIKEYKRKDILNRTIQDYNKNTLNVSLILGQPFYSNFVLHNSTDEDELLHLIITKTGEELKSEDRSTDDNVVRVISAPEEWKYLTEKNKLIKPNDYQCISQNYLIVKPNESIPILIKILSFDENISNSNYIIWVYKKNGQPLYFLSITIVKVFPIIDHLFRYNLPENRYMTVKFPNPFKYDKTKIQKILENYICTDVTTTLQLDPESNDFCFKAKITNEGLKNEFYVLLYLDSYQSSLIATWKFELISIANIDIHSHLGLKLTQKLMIDSEKVPKTVQFFSNNPEVLYFQDNFRNPIILVPSIPNEIKYVIFPKSNTNNDTIVNCVDISNRELLKNWMIRLITEKPQINYVHQIDCKVGSMTNFKYEYMNQLNSWILLNFESNDQELLNVIDTRLPFNSNEKKLINISVPPQFQTGRAEVLVFVSDTEEMFSDTILFQLNYK